MGEWDNGRMGQWENGTSDFLFLIKYALLNKDSWNKEQGYRKQETGNRKQDSSDVNLFFKVLCTEYLFG